jgi:hypothetical protein
MKWASITIEQYTIWIYFSDVNTENRLYEAEQKGQPIIGPYSLILHRPYIPAGLKHLHIYNRQNEIIAINKDGTAHDRNQSVEIPCCVADALRQRFPDWKIPNDNIIDSYGSVLTPIFIEKFLKM